MKTAIIDASGFCYSAAFTVGHLSHNDQRTGVIYGVLDQLLKLSQQLRTNRFVFCWDSKKSLRREAFSWYKNRPINEAEQEEKERMFVQIELLRTHVLPLMGVTNSFKASGFEADDLIAEIVKHSGPTKPFIISADKDLYQLLDYAPMYNPKTGMVFSRRNLMLKYNVTPKQWIRVKAIGGCVSDTVPGVPGIGEGFASKYLSGALTKGKKYEAITSPEGRGVERRNLQLVRLPYKGTPECRLRPFGWDWSGFVYVCDEYHFSSFLKKRRDEWLRMFNLRDS